MFIKIGAELHYIWRAVDQDGDCLDILVQKRRNKKAARRFFRKLLTGQGVTPRLMITDKLRSYITAHRELMTLPPAVMVELHRFREVGTGLIFPSPTKWRKPFKFRKHWLKALEQAGINNFRFHDLRHSAASMLVMNGATLYETAQILGHKSTQTTARYAHLSVEHKQALTDRIMGDLK